MNRFRDRLIYIFLDSVAALLSWFCSIYFLHHTSRNLIHFTANETLNFDNQYWLTLFMAFCLFIYYLSGIYLYPEKQTKLKILITTFFSSFIIANTFFFLLNLLFPYTFYLYFLFVLFASLFLFTTIFRSILCAIKQFAAKKENGKIKTVVIGTGKSAKKIATEIKKRMTKNHFVGYITEHERPSSYTTNNKILGPLSQIDSIIINNDIKEVIIALENKNEKNFFSIINTLIPYDIEIDFLPGLYDILTGKVKIKKLTPLSSITTPSMSDWESCVKRFFDVFFSFFGLILLSPLFIIISLLIKKDSKGKILFCQKRIGKSGKPFNLIKFRTMYSNSEKDGPQLSYPDDKRVTKIGRFLRKYRFDELPQLWNVLNGTMSIVGPRPEREFYIKQISEIAPYFCLTYKVRPGLTSWGPIRIGYSNTIEKMVERLNYDIIYIDNMSLKTDFKIILHTISVIIGGKGI